VAVEDAEEAQVVEDQQVEAQAKETILDLQDTVLSQTQAVAVAVEQQTQAVQESARLPIG
jgi:hypothetical protein